MKVRPVYTKGLEIPVSIVITQKKQRQDAIKEVEKQEIYMIEFMIILKIIF